MSAGLMIGLEIATDRPKSPPAQRVPHVNTCLPSLRYTNIEGIIGRGVAAGAFRVSDVAEAAWQVLGMIDGVNAQSLVRWGDTAERSALLLRAIEGMLGAA